MSKHRNSILNSFLLNPLLLACYVLPFIVILVDLDLSVPGICNLFTGSGSNALDLYMKYTTEVVHLYM